MGANIVEIILKATDQASGVFKKAESSAGKFESGLKALVARLGVAALAGTALKKGLDFAKESTVLAARVETLGAVTQIMGENAGVSAQEIDKLEKSIQAQGITTQASRQALAQMMQAEIDLTKATDLARLAQDAAVVGNMNSSEAFERLTQVIGTGNTTMARTMGLLVDFEGAYQKLASSLGKPVTELTELEKVQARTNEVMAQGRTIAGAYTAAMETGGKKAQSYARHLEELKLEVGKTFVDTFSVAIDVVTEQTDALATLFKADNLLNDAVKEGNITWLERLGIHLQVIATGKTAADVVEDLTEEEAKRNEVMEQANKIFSQAQTYEAYKDRMLDLAFATRGLNVELGFLSETQWFVTKEVTDADAAMLNYANSIGMVIVPTVELTNSTQRYNDASSKFAERARDGAAAIREQEAAALAAADAMQNYFDVFDNTEPADIASNLTDQFSGHLVDAANSAAAAGEDITPYLDALRELDPVAAAAMEQSFALTNATTALDEALLSGRISGDEYAAAIEAMTLGIEAGVDPMIAMETRLDKLGIKVDSNKDGVDDFTQSLQALVSGSPYTVDVVTRYSSVGSPGAGTPGVTIPTGGGGPPKRRAIGGPVAANDVYLVGERGPELFVPTMSGKIVPNEKTKTSQNNNEFHFHINNTMDIYEVAHKVVAILQ